MVDEGTPRCSVANESPILSSQGLEKEVQPSLKLPAKETSRGKTKTSLRSDNSSHLITSLGLSSRGSENAPYTAPSNSSSYEKTRTAQTSQSYASVTDTARVSRRSRSGADLLRGDPAEWWGGDGRSKSSVEVDEEVRVHAGEHCAAVLRKSVEWWRDASNVEETPSDIKEGWWGSQPDVLQGDGPHTGICQQGCFAPLRHMTSGGRSRYMVSGFDLDLTYITSRVIAMGFPAAGKRRMYRNPRTEVAKFLRWRHNDHFRIYNLCIESKYVYNGFPEQTKHFPCPDHCPLSLPMMLEFCRDAEDWLRQEAENVVLVHCKAGKGRSGTLISSLLVYSGAVGSAYEALKWFAKVRGGKRQGVTIPSQIRFLAMFERWLHTQAVGLRSDPMAGASGQLSARKFLHRLKCVRLGPVKSSFLLKRSAAPGAPSERIAGVRVGLSNRATWASKSRMVHWFDEQILSASDDDFLEVKFDASSSPKWEEVDGVIFVIIRKLGGGFCSFGQTTVTATSWWCHSYLNASKEGDLIFDVPKPCIDSLAKDVWKGKYSPREFRLQAIFEDLRDARELSCIIETEKPLLDAPEREASLESPPGEGRLAHLPHPSTPPCPIPSREHETRARDEDAMFKIGQEECLPKLEEASAPNTVKIRM